jgi:hypothetical protein
MEEEFNEYEFKFIYDYVELFENYTTSYINKIISDIINVKNNITTKFNHSIDQFITKFKNNSSNLITHINEKELNNNNSFYFNDLSLEYKEKLDNTILKIIEIIDSNYIDENFINSFIEKQQAEINKSKSRYFN